MIKNISWIKQDKKYAILKTIDDVFDRTSKDLDRIANNNLTHNDITYNFEDDEVILKLHDDVIAKFKFQYIGLYNEETTTWYWSWNVPFVNKKLTKIKDSIRDFKKFLEKNFTKFNQKEIEEYMFYVSNNNFYLLNTDVKKLLSLVVTINDCKGTIKINNSNGTEYLLLTDIVQIK